MQICSLFKYNITKYGNPILWKTHIVKDEVNSIRSMLLASCERLQVGYDCVGWVNLVNFVIDSNEEQGEVDGKVAEGRSWLLHRKNVVYICFVPQ